MFVASFIFPPRYHSIRNSTTETPRSGQGLRPSMASSEKKAWRSYLNGTLRNAVFLLGNPEKALENS